MYHVQIHFYFTLGKHKTFISTTKIFNKKKKYKLNGMSGSQLLRLRKFYK